MRDRVFWVIGRWKRCLLAVIEGRKVERGIWCEIGSIPVWHEEMMG